MQNLIQEAQELQETLIKDRRYIHENAEVHNELPITSAYVMTRLREMGYEPKEICKSGIVAIAGKKPGKTILLRADMDALPIVEENELEFKSRSKFMHACGHDLHTAMLLGAAKLLKNHEDEIDGQVKLMFQPAEETLCGASAMIESGVLENPKVDVALMIHVFAGMPLPTGSIIIPKGGIFSASSDSFKVTVQGKGGHGAMPNTTVDPLNILAHINLAFQEINAREIAPGANVVLTIGQMHGGNSANVIPDTAFLEGSIRTFHKETREFVKARLEQIGNGVASTFRGSATVQFEKCCPSVIVDKSLRDQIFDYAVVLFGEDKLVDVNKAMGVSTIPGSEDFSFISEKVPSIMLCVAAGSPEEGHVFPQHHPRITFNEDALSTGTALYANSAIEWLKNNKN
jgi:amidohydrolase